MAKARNKKQKHNISVYEKKLSQLSELFPRIKVHKFSEVNPIKSRKDYITDIKLPKDYTLLNKSVSAKGEITSVTFLVPKSENQSEAPGGIYCFSA